MNTALASTGTALILLSILVFFSLSLFALKLVTNAKKQRRSQRSLIDLMNSALPQTQCGQCGYEGCRPYARAITQGEAINRCPPGGPETIIKLANLLNEPPLPLNPANGSSVPFSIAFIREDECIGCTKCIKACPVDAIVGGPKLMHTVIVNQCTGCDLCVEPCPVDCIDMIEVAAGSSRAWPLPSRVNNPMANLKAAP
ncbi:MAG: electron transport complex protein RnfB [Pseudohongiellaceae bacterium]|jgi:electron transport complex protein RnfB